MSPTWRTRQEMELQAILLEREKVTRRAIARALGVSRNTVRHVLEAHQKARSEPHTILPAPKPKLPRVAKIDEHATKVQALLRKYPDITAQRVFEILRDEDGFTGGYTGVKKYLRRVRPKPPPTPSLEAPVYGPGEMSECDWSPYELAFTDGTKAHIELFSYTLVYSHRKFYEPFDDYGIHSLMQGHNLAFAHFGGCAQRTMYDGQKAVVQRWEGNLPVYNLRFLAYAAHYEFRVTAVRGQPNAKPRVERSFLEHNQSFLNGRSFRNLDDYRAQLRHWTANVADRRRRYGETPLDRFVADKERLLPLPAHPYDTARASYRLCGIDGYVDWQGNRYAVPYEHVTDILPVRATTRELFLYAEDLRCIARHELAPRGRGLKLDPAGFHRHHDPHHPVVDLGAVRAAFEQIGEGAHDFFKQLSAGPARRWGQVARRILSLRERFATESLDKALGHAVTHGALAAADVERILEARHPMRSFDEYVADDLAKRVERELGDNYAGPRDLDEYDALPLARKPPALPRSTAPEGGAPSWPSDAKTIPSTTTTPRSGDGSDSSD